MPLHALQLVHSQPAEAVLLFHWSRAVTATFAWWLCPTLEHFFLARRAWQMVEGDWLRFAAGRRGR
jgi:hypothetical protein